MNRDMLAFCSTEIWQVFSLRTIHFQSAFREEVFNRFSFGKMLTYRKAIYSGHEIYWPSISYWRLLFGLPSKQNRRRFRMPRFAAVRHVEEAFMTTIEVEFGDTTFSVSCIHKAI